MAARARGGRRWESRIKSPAGNVLILKSRIQETKNLSTDADSSTRHETCQKVYTGQVFKDQILPRSA